MQESRFTLFSRSALRTKIVFWFLVSAIVPLLVAGYISYIMVERQADQSAQRDMVTLAQSAGSAITKFIENRCGDVIVLSKFRFVSDALESPKDRQEASEGFAQMVDFTSLFYAIALADARTGKCVAASRKDLLDTDCSQDEAYAKAKAGQLDVTHLHRERAFEQRDKESTGWCITIAVPVQVQNQVRGVLMAYLQWTAVEKLLLSTKIGRSGYVFVLDDLNRMIVHPQRSLYLTPVTDPSLRVNRIEESLSQHEPSVTYQLPTPTGKSDLKIAGFAYPDPIRNLKNLHFKIGATAPASEILVLANVIGTLGTIVVAVIIVVSFFSWGLAGRISKPITAMAGVARKVADHDLTVQPPVFKGSDEIAELGKAFGSMLESLRIQIKQVWHGAEVLKTAVHQITSSVSEVAASATQIAGSVSETATTMEQLRRAAKMSGEKAKSLSETARSALGASVEGKQATDSTIQGIRGIRDQIGLVDATVHKLDDQSLSIEEIITTVRDLADQSNLLAVNASIEAARAGDTGKGFSVVAHEIKSLADQSRQSTLQIGEVLQSIRNSVAAVVTSMKQVGDAIDFGISQSVRTENSIAILNKSVEVSSQEANVIEASSTQQNTGMDQVSEAMSSIEQAMNQNLGVVRDLEDAATRLLELEAQIRKSVEAYRT